MIKCRMKGTEKKKLHMKHVRQKFKYTYILYIVKKNIEKRVILPQESDTTS